MNMKKWCLFLGVYFALCLLAACGAMKTGEPEDPAREEPPAEDAISCRVISCQDGQLLLAGTGEDGSIYTLSWEEAILPGALVDVTYDGSILETWPAQFSGVTAVKTARGGFDDRCALYLRALEDLWEVDSGLNGDLTYIGMDLSETSLSGGERAAVAWAFAGKHGGELVTGTWKELADQGYIDGENLYWEDGLFFSIKEETVFGAYDQQTLAFDAEKWRGGLGAYYFSDCTAVRSAGGHWGDYTVGTEAIA